MTDSLKSSVEDVGEVVKQVIHFSDGSKKTFKGVITKTIEQSEFTRFDVDRGFRVYINTGNVNWFEVHKS